MNKFYLLKGEQHSAIKGQFNTLTGEFESSSDGRYCVTTWLTNIKPDERKGINTYFMFPLDIATMAMRVFFYDKDLKYLGYSSVYYELEEYIDEEYSAITGEAFYVRCDFKLNITDLELKQLTSAEISSMLTHVWIYAGFRLSSINYSKLTSKYEKETGQVFFRNSIDGTIKIQGGDFEYIKQQDLETKFILLISDNADKILGINTFVKTDCKLDYAKHVIELKLSAIDKYSMIMDAYDNTYDLIKLSPAITPLILTKRLLYQFYIQGANSVTCYANGTYWEQETNDTIDNADELKNKYYFSENLSLQEIIISEDVCPELAGTYVHDAGTPRPTWVNKTIGNGHIKMEGISDLSHTTSHDSSGRKTIRWFNTGQIMTGQEALILPDSKKFALKIYDDREVIGTGVAYSTCVFTLNDENWNSNSDVSNVGQDGEYEFNYARPGSIVSTAFKLGIINYTIWARILADVDTATEPSTGEVKTLYDLPKDDFVSERVNYRKCIGLIGTQVKQTSYTVTYPTKYGRNDSGEYFSSNFVDNVLQHKPIPISRSSWANSSIWAIIPDSWNSFENQFRTEFTLKDAFSLADVIKALLQKINPLIKFEATEEYSKFLYSSDISSIFKFDSYRNGKVPYIIPKSNVLKGNYDQAAQKAEITFEQVMNMLRDCFRCYWYIDDNNRLIIEHISYFMNGLSYGNKQNVQLDLTLKDDKFNKKSCIYAQETISYNKDDLNSRYEFSWMDDSSDIFEDMEIDVDSVYTQSNKTEEINSEVFSTDIDLMLYAPDKFSEDGFALVMADKNTHKVPIFSVSSLRDDEYKYEYTATPQNYLCSWLYLARYYMLDMPAYNITYTRAPIADAYRVTNLKQFKQQNVEFQTMLDIDLNKAIKTTFGVGVIDSMSVNIDTHLVNVTLVF